MIRPGLNVSQMLSDPDEGHFLQTLVAAADNRHTLLEYADYLREQDEVRAEFLRLEHLLSGTDFPDGVRPERQDRYQGLLQTLAPFEEWLRLVKRDVRLLNCGQAPAEPLAGRFRYPCPSQWEALSPTPESGARYCGECRRVVYFCDSAESVQRRAIRGDCIAVPLRVTARVEEVPMFMGIADVNLLELMYLGNRGAPSKQAVRHEPSESREEATDQVQRLAEGLDQLPDDERTAILLRYVQDLSTAEVSTKLGRPRDAVAGLLSRALKKLWSHMTDAE